MDELKCFGHRCENSECIYKTKEGCSLDLNRFREHEANDTLSNIPCAGQERSYAREQVEEQLTKEAAQEKEQSAAVAETPAVAPVQPVEATVIPPYTSYQEYKAALDSEVQQEIEGYVRIGYLLKLARDTSILSESGYKDLYEFAKAEYNLDKSRVSRYININDRFAVDGYSMELLPQYKGFGVAKLSIMLQLPDAVNEGLTPEYTKSEIQSIKDEIDEENKVSDIERMLEPAGNREQSTISKIILQLGEDEPELFVEMAKVFTDECWSVENIKETMAPQGEKTYSIRIPGTGRLMLMLNDGTDARIVNTRTGEAETVGWGEIGTAWSQIMDLQKAPEARWSELYCRPFPAQPEKPKKESKVTRAKPEKKKSKPKADIPKQPESVSKPEESVPKQPESSENTLHEYNQDIPAPDPVPEEPAGTEEKEQQEQQEEQIPGQKEIKDYPEALPDDRKEDIMQEESVAQNPENREKTECEAPSGDPLVNIMLEKVHRLEETIKNRNWGVARIKLSEIRDCINKAEDKEEEN